MRVPQFPPLLNGRRVETGQDPSAIATGQASAGKVGAGDLFWTPDDETARCAVVLEPETSAAGALCMIPLAMVAAADALGAIGEANLAITHRWPSVLLANGARVGGCDMRFPDGTGRETVPEFAVLSMIVAVKWPKAAGFEPGERTDRTVLHEEGCGGIDTADVLEAWSRHFLSWVDTWESQGFGAVGRNWLFRAHGRDKPFRLELGRETVEGTFAGIDDKGGILVGQGGNMRLVSLEDVWFQGERAST